MRRNSGREKQLSIQGKGKQFFKGKQGRFVPI